MRGFIAAAGARPVAHADARRWSRGRGKRSDRLSARLQRPRDVAAHRLRLRLDPVDPQLDQIADRHEADHRARRRPRADGGCAAWSSVASADSIGVSALDRHRGGVITSATRLRSSTRGALARQPVEHVALGERRRRRGRRRSPAPRRSVARRAAPPRRSPSCRGDRRRPRRPCCLEYRRDRHAGISSRVGRSVAGAA